MTTFSKLPYMKILQVAKKTYDRKEEETDEIFKG